MFERAFGITVLRFSRFQARFFHEARRRWIKYGESLSMEENGVGDGEYVVRVWRNHWEQVESQMAKMQILSPGEHFYQRPQPWPNIPSLADNTAPRYQPDAFPVQGRPLPRAKNTSESGSNAWRMGQFLPDIPHPGLLESTTTLSSTKDKPRTLDLSRKRVLYAVAVIHSFDPDTGAKYLGLPFLTLQIGDTLEIFVEMGHPSEHSNLPIQYDDEPDCLLVARNKAGVEGWALASYLLPLV